jgi:hypothetical protein
MWYGNSVSIRSKSAFEIEHSTSIYSGILRLSELRAEAPNSNYPLFIVASEERRKRVFDELRRPTFSGPCLRSNEVIRFLGYQKVREIDEASKDSKNFDATVLFTAAEGFPKLVSKVARHYVALHVARLATEHSRILLVQPEGVHIAISPGCDVNDAVGDNWRGWTVDGVTPEFLAGVCVESVQLVGYPRKTQFVRCIHALAQTLRFRTCSLINKK